MELLYTAINKVCTVNSLYITVIFLQRTHKIHPLADSLNRVLVQGTWLSIKMASYLYRNSHYNDKRISRNHGHGPEVALDAAVRCSGFRRADGSVFQHKFHCLKKLSARFDLTRKKPGLLTQHFICSLLRANIILCLTEARSTDYVDVLHATSSRYIWRLYIDMVHYSL